ncbi:MAG: sigma factor-like helix-turn-helix DNA-binding protein [Campylobacter sp.]|uniref:sigma factor-like helix-turn-helix DNA-binding protein n=1 Tax=Campylobacter sp. TaxID=205 RepID=UPI002A58D6CC|nr:sigma factor-like helix-turn-helix DNA-binding protein [Campylobacter sp.]MDD7090352.1 sigma factor-like helix-turn-helix DNA-binding protein [Campylobacteraceae bacterium]MCI6177768.1 RNA polymerase subunit sigma-70 [Campylobacter sp.]MCI6818797.1 RNA polymerase subunit sigma-70 [Campylobacter sp.]MDY3246613.1 sigma factor-like helix-turn-helix DNA-binding protein [Campylobacter sp.]MDY5285964.1 sigma factor-like helix-turn-helix DNA-binding protein [Campylobacter sp.]
MTDVCTLDAVAKRLGVTKERVRQLEAHALRKLRHPKNNKAWREIFETIAMIEQLNKQSWVLKGVGRQ